MLSESQIVAMIPCVDLNRAREFYGNTLGLKEMSVGQPSPDEEYSGVGYVCGNDSLLFVYQRPSPTKADHTVASWIVEDFDAAVDDLISRGITFEKYDMPGVDFDERGVANMGRMRTAWFADPEGNILSLSEMPEM